MNPTQPQSDQRMTHVVYDKATGRILGTLRHFELASGEYRQYDEAKVLELFSGDDTVLARVTDGDVRNLAMMTAELPVAARVGALRVSQRRQSIVPRPRLRLRSDREVLEGDGVDSVTITIDVVDEEGHVQRDYAGEVHVTTTRGKLSAKGGLVNVEGGQASVTLTSVRETVDRVQVKARTRDGSAASNDITLSFE